MGTHMFSSLKVQCKAVLQLLAACIVKEESNIASFLVMTSLILLSAVNRDETVCPVPIRFVKQFSTSLFVVKVGPEPT